MRVFVVVCCNIEDDTTLFVDRVYQDEQEAINYCSSQSEKYTIQAHGIYFTYEETYVLQHIKVGEKSPYFYF